MPTRPQMNIPLPLQAMNMRETSQMRSALEKKTHGGREREQIRSQNTDRGPCWWQTSPGLAFPYPVGTPERPLSDGTKIMSGWEGWLHLEQVGSSPLSFSLPLILKFCPFSWAAQILIDIPWEWGPGKTVS